MRGDELFDTGRLTGTVLSELTTVARDTHRAVATRLFGLAGRPGAAVRLAHDGIAAIAYGSTALGVRHLPPALGYVAGALRDPAAGSTHDTRRGRAVVGALSGVVGHRMADESTSLAPALRLRVGDGPLRAVPENLAADARDAGASGRLVLFVHGLSETDLAWSYAAEKRWGDRRTTYGSKLAADTGRTPLYLVFNTGLHVSANGLALAELLERTIAAWPVEVSEIAIVGHSLGGLLARSAAHQGRELGQRWPGRLRHIVSLGAPHLGAPLERAVNRATHRMERWPETRPLARFVNQRSAGVKDLRHGAFLEADWLGHDPDDPGDHCRLADLIPGVTYSTVSATLSRGTDGPFAHDLLVQHASAHGIGRARSIPFGDHSPDHTHHIGGGKHHFDLLADETVYAKLREWLGTTGPRDGADAAL